MIQLNCYDRYGNAVAVTLAKQSAISCEFLLSKVDNFAGFEDNGPLAISLLALIVKFVRYFVYFCYTQAWTSPQDNTLMTVSFAPQTMRAQREYGKQQAWQTSYR